MESNDDRTGADGAQRDHQHELLCKLVFGEASDAERAEIEEALAASEHLREQRAELEATVQLVAGVRGSATSSASETLSADRHAAILKAAILPGKILGGEAWFQRPAARVAAAVTLLVGMGVAVMAVRQDQWTTFDESVMATAEVARERPTDAEPAMKLAPYGRRAVVGDPAAGAAPADFSPEVAQGAVLLGAATENQRGAGGGGSAIEPKTIYVAGAGAQSGVEVLDLSGFGGSTGPPVREGDTTLSYGSRGGGATTVEPTMVGDRPQLEVDYRGLGAPAPPVESEALKSLGYGGSGETVPPGGGGGGGGPSSPRVPLGAVAGGPSSPGPVGPAGTGRPGIPHAGAMVIKKAPGDAAGSPALAPSTRVSGETSVVPPTERLRRRSPGLDTNARSAVDVRLELTSPDRTLDADEFFLGRGAESPEEERVAPWRGAGDCLPEPLAGESPRDMYFRFWGDNPFVPTRQDGLSTFAADVDTASYGLARRMLREGFLPPREQVRTEEFVNAAKPDLAAPEDGAFALHAELAPSPFGGREDRWLLRLGVRAREVERDARPPLALTFVVDTSGSMREGNRLELVKHAIRLLVGELDSRDSIAIVRFSKDASEALPPTSATSRDAIETALFSLQPGGGTNAEAGLELGYSLASMTLMEGVQTRVVFLSDGVANLGETDQKRLADEVADSVGRGIFLNTIGVGMSNHNDVFLEQLADRGQGVCDYVGDAADARRAIVERFVGSFVTVARDVKIQVEFDPNQVVRWRQLGYENRAVADRDFRNDAVDAGEIGAGHQVTCLYELELPGGEVSREAALAKLRVRWKPVVSGEQPRAVEALELERAVTYEGAACASFDAAPRGFRRAALAAQLAECLRRSTHARGDSVEALGKAIGALLAEDRSDESAQLAEMAQAAIQLDLQSQIPALRPDDGDAAHRKAYLDALIQSLGGDPESASSEDPLSEILGR